MSRFPLWLMPLPLLAGILIWYWIWDGYRDTFVTRIEALFPGTALTSGGFPYRLEVDIAPVMIGRQDSALGVSLTADEVRINRVPWQKDRQVLGVKGPEARIDVRPLTGASISARAVDAVASLRLAPDHIARLSIVWARPQFVTGLLPGTLTAEKFESHLRETPAPASVDAPENPRLPTQAQLVLHGEQMRWNGGDPLSMRMEAEFTANGPLNSYAAWAVDGTAEMESLTLDDATGRLALIQATLVPDGKGRLRIAGTIETVCPATIRALAAGDAPPAEMRTRRPISLAFSGMLPGGIQVSPPDPTRPPPPVRGQQPPCPRFVGMAA